MIRKWYQHADRIVAISDGVACDLSQVSELPRERITTVYNGADLRRLEELAASPVADPWFGSDAPRVLLV